MKDIIKKELNNSIDEMAPDILASILETKIDRNAFSEEDLRDEPLFLDEAKNKKVFWMPAISVACMAMLLIAVGFATNFFNNGTQNTVKTLQCTITLDVNPSIDIVVDEEGFVDKIVANNEDAQAIVKKINNKLKGSETVDEVMQIAVKRIKKAGYLENETAAMLVSVEKNTQGGREGLGKARKVLNEYKKETGNSFVTVYQEYEENEEVKKVAKENNVSVAKAAYCIKVAEKSEETYEELCQETIADITTKVVESDIDLGLEIAIVEEVETFEEETTTAEEETTTVESETTTAEGETVTGENESEVIPKETTTLEGEETTTGVETTTVIIEETTYIDETITVVVQ